MENRQLGFTLVELIVVILILGVLSATALPRFINLGDKAHDAAVKATGGAFASAVSLAKAQWIANGHTAFQSNLQGFGANDVDMSAQGWPVGTSMSSMPAGGVNRTSCRQIWEGILSNPPSITESTSNPNNDDYIVASDEPDRDECTYTYTKKSGYVITYIHGTGEVVVTTPP